MKTWDVFTTADQLRNAIRALLNPGDATATNTYLGFGTDNLPVWNHLPTATQAATATDVSANLGFAKAWAFWGTVSATGLLAGFPSTLTVSRTSAGNYTIDFGGKLFAASQYAWQTAAEQDVGTLVIFTGKNATGPSGMLASSFDFIAINSGGAAADPNFMSAIFYGVT